MGSEVAMDSSPSPAPEPSGMALERRFVGVLHEFQDAVYARDWADRFTPSPSREALFATMLEVLEQHHLPHPRVLELGIGPAYFAERLLRQRPDLHYEGLDFSQAMLDLAAERPVGAIVSTWALHDLGAEERTAKVYADSYRLLEQGGILLNGDFVKPEDTTHDYEPGRFTVSRHLELLTAAEFSGCQCLGFWEKELKAPTTAHNYACLLAVKEGDNHEGSHRR
jgi:hypothetical protein